MTSGNQDLRYWSGTEWVSLQGPQGPPGPDPNTILYGAAGPDADDGSDGDFFINTTSNFFFGPKVNGVWPPGVPIVSTDIGNQDLAAIAGLVEQGGLLRKNAPGIWSIDLNTYLTGNQTITLSGDVTGSGTTSITSTLANSGVTAGTYGSASVVPEITVDAKGRITGVTGRTVHVTISGSDITSGTVDQLYIDANIARTANTTFTGITTFNGGKRVNVKNKIADYTLETTDYVINATTGTWTATLPSAVGNQGQELIINNAGNGVITVVPAESQNISGVASIDLTSNEAVKLISTGVNWIII